MSSVAMEQQQKFIRISLPVGGHRKSGDDVCRLTGAYIVKTQPGKLPDIRSAGFILVQYRGDRTQQCYHFPATQAFREKTMLKYRRLLAHALVLGFFYRLGPGAGFPTTLEQGSRYRRTFRFRSWQ